MNSHQRRVDQRKNAEKIKTSIKKIEQIKLSRQQAIKKNETLQIFFLIAAAILVMVFFTGLKFRQSEIAFISAAFLFLSILAITENWNFIKMIKNNQSFTVSSLVKLEKLKRGE